MVLSGGGLRALIFHLGVLRWLAERSAWDQIKHVSSVSGGSWCVGCIIGHSGGHWPSADVFLSSTLPAIKNSLTQHSMRRQLVLAALMRPWLLVRRALILAKVFEKHWGLDQNLASLPDRPVFHIEATNFETGKRWVFMKEKMGDYLYGYAENPDYPLSHAVAASSGFPYAAGPIPLDSRKFSWLEGPFAGGQSADRRTIHPVVHLWDGGVYENTGLEPLYKNGSLRHNLSFLIVADAAETLPILGWDNPVPYAYLVNPLYRMLRLLGIAMDQVRSLRARQTVATFAERGNGFYALIGKSPEHHLNNLDRDIDPWFEHPLTDETCEELARLPIWPAKIAGRDFDNMVTHGWQTCETIFGALFERGAHLDEETVADPEGVAVRD